MNDLAAALLRDAIISGMRIATETPIEQVPAAIADVLAALSRALDPALAERAGEVLGEAGLLASTCERSGQHKRAETIRAAVMAGTALLTANAALRAERDRYLRHLTAGAESLNAYKARAEAAEAQIAALTAQVERLTGAVKGLVEILDRHETKGPLPDVALMLCWLAAQDVRAVMREIGGQ